jgi:hypothetical protein
MKNELLSDEMKEDILKNKEVIECEAKLGKNRGQYFVRIPNKIAQRLIIEEGDSFRFIVKGNYKKIEFNVELVKKDVAKK